MDNLFWNSPMGQIHLLPALPDAWSAGNVKGLKARGGFELDCRWKDGEISEAVIRSMHGGPCRVRSAVCLTVTQDGREVATRTVADELIEFSTTENAEYCLKATPRDVD
jgi:alpha-L-fucosidase 2